MEKSAKFNTFEIEFGHCCGCRVVSLLWCCLCEMFKVLYHCCGIVGVRCLSTISWLVTPGLHSAHVPVINRYHDDEHFSTICTFDRRICFRPNKLRLILKSQISNSIEHIIPTCSVKSKYSPVVSTRFRVKLFPIIGYRRILLSHVHIVHCKNIQYLNKV